jgi:uncharacterized protein (UPF0332 family)
MGSGLSSVLSKLLEERKLMRMRTDRALVEKEIAASNSDLRDAKESLGLKKYKWATIQGYYAAFHAARAMLFAKGFREKSHHALLVAIRESYGSEIEHSLLREFEHSMYLRKEADYGLKFSATGATDVIETGGENAPKSEGHTENQIT